MWRVMATYISSSEQRHNFGRAPFVRGRTFQIARPEPDSRCGPEKPAQKDGRFLPVIVGRQTAANRPNRRRA